MRNQRIHMPENVVLKRSNSGLGECVTYHTPFTRVRYLVHRALSIMSRGGGFESPICRRLLYIRRTPVDVCSSD